MTKQSKDQCPNCGQYKLEPRWGRIVLAGGWLTFVGLPLMLLLIGFIFIPVGIMMMVFGRLLLRGERCANCNWNSVRA